MAELIGMNFWNRIEAVKGDKSLRKICIEHGISYDTVKSAKLNNRLLSRDNTLRFAEALGVSVAYLMGTEEPVKVNEDCDPSLCELISLCKDNPGMAEKLLSMARIMLK